MRHAARMRRRELLTGLSSASATLLGLSACTSPSARLAQAPRTTPAAPGTQASHGRVPIRGICFDLFTLFDPRSVVEAAKPFVADQAAALCETWRTRQFEYGWIRASAGIYVDFRQVTRDALEYASRARGLTLTEDARETLVDAYSKLEPWPDTRAQLAAWRAAGLRLAPLANYSPRMLEALIDHSGLAGSFDALISTDAARTFKPDPRAYALGPSTLGLDRREIAFSAFGGWDAAGAKWFGYPTFWVNRLSVPREELAPAYDDTGTTLAELATFVDATTRGAEHG
jgi:2-haloacid dehalogenase